MKMLNILYEDNDIIVVVKPAGIESQSAKRFAPDMISEIRKHLIINKLSTTGKEPYVAVIHRLDKPVSGVMVYAKTKNAAAKLSEQVQNHKMEKIYTAVVCGKPVNTVDNFVDYLKKSVDGNYSQVVDKGINDAKRAELSFETKKTIETEEGILSLVRIWLMTGRHHQIRVQFASHGLPLYGDGKYNPYFGAIVPEKQRIEMENIRKSAPALLALCSVSLTFTHPITGKRMEFSIEPSGGAFEKFCE